MKLSSLFTLLAGLGVIAGAHAADWSDTSIGWRYGTQFQEPFDPNQISKNIIDLQHVSGYKYGTNFLNVDLLMSDNKDPAAGNPATGAQEAYVVYRNTVSLSKVSGTPMKFFGVIRDVNIQAGFDWNTKNDVGYQSKKRMLVIGPTVSIDVPGFWDVGVLEFFESNAPAGIQGRYHYDPHPALSTAFGIPIGSLPLSFEGFGLWIAAKGKDEFGNATVAETNIDAEIMLDVGKATGGTPNTFKVGFEYQWWQNKFGNDGTMVPGVQAHTPMIRAEYHF